MRITIALTALLCATAFAQDADPWKRKVFFGVGGGVAANGRLRERLKDAIEEVGVRLHIAPLKLCTDNAVMGAIAVERYRAREFESLELDIAAGLVRT